MRGPLRQDFNEFARIWSGAEHENIAVHSGGINSPYLMLKDFFDVTRIRMNKSMNRDLAELANVFKHIDDRVRINYLKAEKWLYEETKPSFLSDLDHFIKRDLFFGGSEEREFEGNNVNLYKRAKTTHKRLAENREAGARTDGACKKARREDNKITHKIRKVIDYSEPITINRSKFEEAMHNLNFTTAAELRGRLGRKEANYWIKRAISLSKTV